MSALRGTTDLSGILLVDKPAGVTSHDVVNRVRRACGERRVGHAGTLDPMATGVLVVLVGPATRLAPYLTAAEKSYSARILFGAQTDTDDADGRVILTAPVPDEIGDPFFASGMVASLVGTHDQVPPAYCAIKRGGKVAYEVARKGESLELPARTVEVLVARLTGVELEPPAWDVELVVSKGTYIRALARDLGQALDTAAYLGTLCRTRSGALNLEQTASLEDIEAAVDVAALFVDPLAALDLPVASVSEAGASAVACGNQLGALELADAPDGPLSVARDGVLLAVYERKGATARALAVIPGGVSGGAR